MKLKIPLKPDSSSFYNAVKYYKSSSDDLTKEEQKLSKKCKSFLKDLDRWRGYVKMKSISALIWTLYEETGFYDFMGALFSSLIFESSFSVKLPIGERITLTSGIS